MASERQVAANRANALKSTGPRTQVGKTESSKNALTHGLTARVAMLPGEDPNDFERLLAALQSSLSPEGALEQQLVQRTASLMWRLGRIPAIEAALIEWAAKRQAVAHDPSLTGLELTRTRIIAADRPREPLDLTNNLNLGRVMEALLEGDLLGKLGRYEAHGQRQLATTLIQLRETQKARLTSDQRRSGPPSPVSSAGEEPTNG